jgi:predicted nucleic acid-binding protein
VTFVDSNVLIDVLENVPNWVDWSSAAIAAAASRSTLTINTIVIGELAAGYESVSVLLERLDRLGVLVEPLGNEPAFIAGKRFAAYRRGGRDRSAVLSDFLIGAHALVLGMPLLTRDTRIYRKHFPEIALITPENDNG